MLFLTIFLIPLLSFILIFFEKKLWRYLLITLGAGTAYYVSAFVYLFNIDLSKTGGDIGGLAIACLFVQLSLALSVLIIFIGTIVILAKRGFYTQKKLKGIAMILGIIVLLFSLFIAATKIIHHYSVKKYPDMIFYGSSFDGGKHTVFVHWFSSSNRYKIIYDEDDATVYKEQIDTATSGDEVPESKLIIPDRYSVDKCVITSDGRYVFYNLSYPSSGENEENKKLYMMDLETGNYEVIAAEDRRISDLEITHDGSAVIYNCGQLKKYDIASGTITTLLEDTRPDTKGVPGDAIVRISADDRYVIYYVGVDHEFVIIPYNKAFVYDTETGKTEVVLKTKEDIQYIDWAE